MSYRAAAFSSMVIRGMQISRPGSPVAMLGADAYAPSGWSVGAALTHLRSPTGEWGTGLSLRVGQEWSLDDTWSLNLSARHDSYHGSAYLQIWCYNQVSATLVHEDQWNLTASWRPRHGPGCDNFSVTPNRAIDLGGRLPLWQNGGLDAGLGRLAGGPQGYTYGQLGVYGSWGQASAHLARTSTWGAPAAGPGSPQTAGQHWVASLVWNF